MNLYLLDDYETGEGDILNTFFFLTNLSKEKHLTMTQNKIIRSIN